MGNKPLGRREVRLSLDWRLDNSARGGGQSAVPIRVTRSGSESISLRAYLHRLDSALEFAYGVTLNFADPELPEAGGFAAQPFGVSAITDSAYMLSLEV